MTPEFECQCEDCKGACKHKPGWFKPGEAEVLAKNMGITLQELFDKHLLIDWWAVAGGEPIFLLSPAVVGEKPGREFPGEPRGKCVFYKRGKCTIHQQGKPYECAMLAHDDNSRDNHRAVAMAWNKKKHQKLIRKLLGRKPQAEQYRGGGLEAIMRSILGME